MEIIKLWRRKEMDRNHLKESNRSLERPILGTSLPSQHFSIPDSNEAAVKRRCGTRTIFCTRAKLELRVSSADEPKPVKISLRLASSPSFLLMKTIKFEIEPTSSLFKKGLPSFEPEPRLVPSLVKRR